MGKRKHKPIDMGGSIKSYVAMVVLMLGYYVWLIVKGMFR